MENSVTRCDFFLCSNSSAGYFNFYNDNLDNLNCLTKFVNCPVDSMIAELIKIAEKEGLEFEVVHNCLDNSLDGIIVPEKSIGVVNITTNTADRNEAFALFAEAKKIHDEWEKIYIKNTDFSFIDDLALKYSTEFFKNLNSDAKGTEKRRFFGAATENGAVDYIKNITENIEKRFFIKGRPGSGKSGFLKKIAKSAVQNGFDTEIYCCAFDPESVDMVVIRGRGVCFFDSTAPHEYFPEREGDEVIELYGTAINANTDLVYNEKIKKLSADYTAKMQQATAVLSECAKRKREEDANKLSANIYDFESVIKQFEKNIKK